MWCVLGRWRLLEGPVFRREGMGFVGVLGSILCDCTHDHAVHSSRFPCPADSELSTVLEGELPFADLYLDAMLLSLGEQINLTFEYPPV